MAQVSIAKPTRRDCHDRTTDNSDDKFQVVARRRFYPRVLEQVPFLTHDSIL